LNLGHGFIRRVWHVMRRRELGEQHLELLELELQARQRQAGPGCCRAEWYAAALPTCRRFCACSLGRAATDPAARAAALWGSLRNALGRFGALWGSLRNAIAVVAAVSAAVVILVIFVILVVLIVILPAFARWHALRRGGPTTCPAGRLAP
jgi:hypothetical protein